MTPITPIPATFEDFVYYTNNLIRERERELWCLTPLSTIFQLYRILIFHHSSFHINYLSYVTLFHCLFGSSHMT